jgi:5-aminopentanamidase
MSVKTMYKVGVVQAQDIQDDVEETLSVVRSRLKQADAEGLSVLCFPECFLQGYTQDIGDAKQRAMYVDSLEFREVLNTLKPYSTTAILGMIEEDAGSYFNTAVVIKDGKLLGKYRKIHLFEKNFEPGDDYPVFTVDGLTFGINICYDARFSEGAQKLAEKGARVIFYPLNNRLLTEKAIKYRDKHLLNLVARAKETGCWVVSSDVVAQDSETIGYGCTAIVSPKGATIERATELEEAMVSVQI